MVLCSSLFFKERTHLHKCCTVLSLSKKELVLTVLRSSLFSKERTCLDSVVQFSLFQRKDGCQKVRYIYIYI
jgi:uncharacterized membrane protein